MIGAILRILKDIMNFPQAKGRTILFSRKTPVRKEVVHGIIGVRMFHSWIPCRRSDGPNWRLGRPLLWGPSARQYPGF